MPVALTWTGARSSAVGPVEWMGQLPRGRPKSLDIRRALEVWAHLLPQRWSQPSRTRYLELHWTSESIVAMCAVKRCCTPPRRMSQVCSSLGGHPPSTRQPRRGEQLSASQNVEGGGRQRSLLHPSCRLLHSLPATPRISVICRQRRASLLVCHLCRPHQRIKRHSSTNTASLLHPRTAQPRSGRLPASTRPPNHTRPSADHSRILLSGPTTRNRMRCEREAA